MLITYKITDADKRKYSSSSLNKKKQTVPKLLFYSGTIILVLISLIAIIAKDFSFATPIIAFLIVTHLLANIPKLLKNKYIKSIDSDEERTIEISKDSLIISNPSRSTSYNYSDIKSVDYVDDYFVLIKFNLGDSSLIPVSAFSNNTEMIDFVNKIKTNAKIL